MRISYILPTFILGLLAYLLVGVSFTFAQNVSSSSYDWSATLEASKDQVLGVAYAQESSTSAQSKSVKDFVQFNRYLIGANFTPASPFYFIKPLQENLQLAFTFDQRAKDQLKIEIAGERLDELERLASSKNTPALTASANAYQQAMSSVADDLPALKKANANVDDLLKKLEEETAKHDVVLEQVKVQVPDAAEASLDKALEASWKGTDTVADLRGRPAMPPDVISRLQSLKAQGLLSAEEVNKLVNVKSRVEARSEIEKYVHEGVVPEADSMRLNETAKSFYPGEFYQIHELKRFEELQRLESEKPDAGTLTKIQAFAKGYNPGDSVPAALRRYWIPVVRLEEIQNTLRPDLIDANLFKNNQGDTKRFNEVVERFKPRPEDVAYLNSYIKKNSADVNNLPPEYQRMYNLSQRYGAQCGAGSNWVPESQNPAGGYCVSQGSNTTSVPRYDDFTRGKACSGTIISAKASTTGACSAYPSDCLPPGWSKVDSCVSTPTGSGGSTNSTGNRAAISCPANAHFVPVPYDPSGGYCIPNYTPTATTGITGTNASGQYEVTCSTGSHRSYAGGPCVPDYNYNNNYTYLPTLTATPGGAYYTGVGRCGNSAHWVPESINPNGGYCVPDSYQSPNQGSSLPGTNGVPKTDMGNCRTPGECYDFCRSNPTAPSCSGFNPSQPRPGDAGSRESQEAACRAGGGTCVSWFNGTCGCNRAGQNGSNDTNYTSPSRESQEAACRSGGGTCVSWVNGACGCEHYNSGNTGTTYGSGSSRESQEAACRAGGGTCVSWVNGACGCNGSGSSGGGTPSGYGSCSSGMRWNGSYCVSEASPTNFPQEDPATACTRGGGCTWNGSSCQCPSSTSGSGGGSTATPTPAPAATSAPTATPAPTAAPAPTSQPQSTPDPSAGCASIGKTWNGSSCI